MACRCDMCGTQFYSLAACLSHKTTTHVEVDHGVKKKTQDVRQISIATGRGSDQEVTQEHSVTMILTSLFLPMTQRGRTCPRR
eukprot:scaffold1143_cov96-Cylindrotheca_fusiformis.AAC.11